MMKGILIGNKIETVIWKGRLIASCLDPKNVMGFGNSSLEHSMKKIKPTVSPDELQKYDEWTKKYASE